MVADILYVSIDHLLVLSGSALIVVTSVAVPMDSEILKPFTEGGVRPVAELRVGASRDLNTT